MNLQALIDPIKEYLVQVRRYLHQNPELSLYEYKTAEYLEKELSSFGIETRRIGDTGVLGIIQGVQGGGKTILLRADIDALPIQEETGLAYQSANKGVMHACGHDVHTAALLGAAKVLQQNKDLFAGRVLLAFQQAEEFGSGSRYFVREGIPQQADRAFGIHVWPEFKAGIVAVGKGTDAASCDFFCIEVQGKAAHISKPHLGVDAVYIASQIVIELKALVRELVNPFETALVGVGKIQGGTTYNIVAETAQLEGTIRALSTQTQALLKQKIEETATSVAQRHGGTASTSYESFTSVLVNDETAWQEVGEVARQLVGDENVVLDRTNIMGLAGDDFSEFAKETKGVYAHVGIANDNNPNTSLPLHSAKFEVDERALHIAAGLHVGYALWFLGQK